MQHLSACSTVVAGRARVVVLVVTGSAPGATLLLKLETGYGTFEAFAIVLTLVEVGCHGHRRCPTPFITDLVADWHVMGQITPTISITLTAIHFIIAHQLLISKKVQAQICLVLEEHSFWHVLVVLGAIRTAMHMGKLQKQRCCNNPRGIGQHQSESKQRN